MLPCSVQCCPCSKTSLFWDVLYIDYFTFCIVQDVKCVCLLQCYWNVKLNTMSTTFCGSQKQTHINHQRSKICLSYWLCNWKLHDSFVQFYEDIMSIFHRHINRWKMNPFQKSQLHKSIKGFLSIRILAVQTTPIPCL